MIRYEIKKVFGRAGNRVVLAILAAVLLLNCFFAVNVTYVDRSGNSQSGIAAARRLRAEKKEWAGMLDEARIRAVIEENVRNRNSPEARSSELRDNEIAYSRGQGYEDIRMLCCRAFSGDYQEFDYYLADRLSPEVAGGFYENRVQLLKNWMADEGTGAAEMLSPSEQGFLAARYEALETPFRYDYHDGWGQLFEYGPVIMMLLAILLGFLVGGIFSNEFAWRTDAVFFASLHGRGRAVRAKLATGAIIVTLLYWAAMLAFSAFVLLALGADGADCPIQIGGGYWKSFYNLSFGEAWCVILLGGYIGCLFLALLAMMVSAASRSSAAAVLVPVVLIFIPEFLADGRGRLAGKLLGLLPGNLLKLPMVLKQFTLYGIGERIVGSVALLPILYAALAFPLLLLIYRSYRKKQIV